MNENEYVVVTGLTAWEWLIILMSFYAVNH